MTQPPQPPPEPVVAVLGVGLVAAHDPVVTADDVGLTRGDGCFDSARVVTGDDGVAEVVGLAGHLRRLASSAAALDLPCPGEQEWEGLVAVALSAWHTPGEGTLKLLLTRGREWTPGRPTALAVLTHRGDARRAADRGAFAARRGLRVVTLSSGRPSDAFVDAPWLLGGVKTLSYAANAAAVREARRRGADDALFVSTDGFALDGTTSGLLVARAGQLLSTPTGGTGILPSTSVARTLDAARADGMPARYALVAAADLPRADGVWLLSSSRGPAPVTHLDGVALTVDPQWGARIAGYAGF